MLPVTLKSTEQLNCFLYDRKHIIWAGTNNGNLLRLANGNLSTIKIPSSFHVRSLTQDKQDNIWVGTDKGLYVYNNAGNLLKNFTIETGLLNDCIYSLLPADSDAVFASSNLGLSYITLHAKPVNYTKESGLQENEFNTGSAVKTNSGKFYFGGVNGITTFYPGALFNIIDKPRLNITKLAINDSVYTNYSGIIKNNAINLRYNQNRIELSFAAIGLLNTNEYVYNYRLQNFETIWQTTHEPTGIKYALPPGNYVFEINCHPIFSSGKSFTRFINIKN